eukprot:5598259-Prymnesium_polylepis.1
MPINMDDGESWRPGLSGLLKPPLQELAKILKIPNSTTVPGDALIDLIVERRAASLGGSDL